MKEIEWNAGSEKTERIMEKRKGGKSSERKRRESNRAHGQSQDAESLDGEEGDVEREDRKKEMEKKVVRKIDESQGAKKGERSSEE
jgi:hypothetical protein